MKNNDCFRLKDSQSGMALIEVLVAMLVLTIGILALLSVQLRTVASVREAETQTIVSQITQNLMERMLMNPTIDSDSNKKNYNLYMGNHHTLSAVDGDFQVDAIKTKTQLAEAQLKRFSYELKKCLAGCGSHPLRRLQGFVGCCADIVRRQYFFFKLRC